MGKYFGTDGIRGVANLELTPELAYKVGRAGAYVLNKENNHKPTIIVGMDTRISGDMLEASLISGMCSVGAKVISLGIIPTSAVAYLVKKYNADAGVMISASHNPFKDNGIKFFNNKGFKLSDNIEEEIENYIDNNYDKIPYAIGEDIGYKEIKEEAIEDYVDFLKSAVGTTFDGISATIDCANGATYQVAPILFEQLKVNTNVIFREPNGTNINDNCGSTHMEKLCEEVLANKSNIGIAFDGDGDRCLVVDENGSIVDGDEIMAICGAYLKEEGKLKDNTIVATIMSNLGLFIMGEKNDINILKTKVGDRYVLEEMLLKGLNFGGEQSGHIIYLDYNTTGDGILTAIKLLEVMKKTGKSLSELRTIIKVLPQALVNAKVDNKNKYNYLENEEIKQAIDKLEKMFDGKGRVLIRPSGTEPLVRVMIEGDDQKVLDEEAKKLAKLIEEKLG
ncbi:phosphoglucosamine mutase [[Clostridium] colinum]|uniref:phosphoglucosamine mutase n=1 Tax=[Clostridium] colinum TaxID=36835 RepID=UPI0020255CDD|nr:phosphoglucosamine mutase [[Clostridium] colinum]